MSDPPVEPGRNEFGQPVGEPLATVTTPDVPSSGTMAGRWCRLERAMAATHSTSLFREYSAASDAGDWTYLPYGPFGTESEFGSWLSGFDDQSDPMFFAVCDLVSGEALGLASYLRITPTAAGIEVGHIHLSRRLQRTAAATEAMYLMMQRAFASGYRRYEWKCDSLNEPSRRAAARLGFTFEGVFRQHSFYKGRNRDTAWFSIIDREWPAIEDEFRRWLDPSNFDESGAQLTPLRHRR